MNRIWLNKWLPITLGLLVTVAVLGGGYAWWRARPFALPEGVQMEGKPAPDFRLTDQFGRSLSLSDLRGQVVLLTFIDSRCTDVCEFTALELAKAQDALGAQRDRVAVVAVNANPRHTAVADVLAYSRQFHMAERWRFVTGPPEALAQVWKDYYIGVQVGPDGDVTHQVAVYVIDRRGRERALLLPHDDPMVRAERILADLHPLL